MASRARACCQKTPRSSTNGQWFDVAVVRLPFICPTVCVLRLVASHRFGREDEPLVISERIFFRFRAASSCFGEENGGGGRVDNFLPSVAVLLLLPTRQIVDDCAADQNSGVHSHLANAYGRHRKPKCPLVHAAVPRIANNAALIVCDASQKENFSPGVRRPVIFALVVLLFVNDISRGAFEKRISKKRKPQAFDVVCLASSQRFHSGHLVPLESDCEKMFHDFKTISKQKRAILSSFGPALFLRALSFSRAFEIFKVRN